MEFRDGIYLLADGEVAVWYDGCVCLKTRNKYHDPVELADEEAQELADILLRLSTNRRPEQSKS
jgi:hypothetical protein